MYNGNQAAIKYKEMEFAIIYQETVYVIHLILENNVIKDSVVMIALITVYVLMVYANVIKVKISYIINNLKDSLVQVVNINLIIV